MKYTKLFILIIYIFFTPKLFAQIIIVNDQDMMVAGVYTISTDVSVSLNVDSTGQDYIWDFSNLQRLSTENDTLLTVSSAPFIYQFAYNNIFDLDHKATVVQSNGTQNTGNASPVQITNNFDYFKNSSSIFSKVGSGSDLNGVPTVQKYDNVEYIVTNFPLTYNDSISSVSNTSTTIPTIGYYGIKLIRTNTVDGYGTVITPFGSFDAIRVKSIINSKDTIYYDNLSMGISFNRPEKIEYTWYSNTETYPVLRITEQSNIYTAVYRDSANLVSVINNKSKFETKVYPTITNDLLNIEILNDSYSSVNILIFNSNGQLVRELVKPIIAGKSTFEISLKSENIVAGQYIIISQVDNNIDVNKFIIID